ncbi:MAG TPA: J domain-containing protein [Acidimicrobiales bacterium]|nr:J domain-containing protein [Acidimicrobiales bacterium]
MSHYEVLGVDRSADPATVRSAYLSLARRHHPDSGDGGDAGRMAEVNAAWAVLGDTQKRAAYDDTLGPVVTERPEPPPWRPYDDSDDPEPMPAEDVVAVTPARSAMTLAPAILFAVAVASFAVGLVVDLAPVLAFGLVALVAAGVSFVLVPVVSMFESMRDDPDRR